MSEKDPLFTVRPLDQTSMLNARIARTEGAIPYIRRANQVFSGSPVKAPSRNSVNPVNSGSQASGTINPDTGIANVGNAFPFVIQGQFGFTSDANSITLFWDGTNGSKIFAVKRVDGTNYTIPSGSMTIGGLQPGTLYGFLPYNKLTSQNQLSFTIGDAGVPQFAFSPNASPDLIAQANQNQSLASNESVTNSFVYYSTTAAGTSTGVATPGIPTAYPGQKNRPGI